MIKKKVSVLVRSTIAACVVLFALSGYANEHPKSVVLLISDGTGMAQITALRYTADDFQLSRFHSVGLFTTHSLDKLVTDSAAGATAFATGYKTNNGMVSTLPDGTKPRTVLERAESRGKATGLVATSQITHATPACFSAHVEIRKNEMDIARQQAAQEIEVLLGGGQKFFLENDGGNLVESMVNNGYTYLDNKQALEQLNTTESEKVLGLFAESGMSAASERKISLSLMTQKAVETLDNDEDGFFLMVEASQVDWRAHGHEAEGVIAEMQDMNDALKWLLDYQQAHPEVLVLWVSDHETGGMAIEYGSSVQKKKIEADWTTEGHTGQMVPAFAMGPGAEAFQGVYDNTDIGTRLLRIFE